MNSHTLTDSVQLSSNLLSTVGELYRFFASRGVDAYLVGGAVRDSLLGRPTPDVDVVADADTVALGRQLAQSLEGRFVLLDRARGIARVLLPGSDDDSGVVDLKPMHAGITEDLQGRDFTCDALAVPLADAAAGRIDAGVIDPCNGLSDIRSGVIRAVSPSVFNEDPVRLMRAPRLAAQLGFAIAQDTARQIRNEARLVQDVAPERVRDELLKLLAEPGASDSVRLLDDLGLLCEVIPELADCRGVVQPKEHYWDVLDHLKETPGYIEKVAGARTVRDEPAAVPRFDGMDEHFAQRLSDGHSRLTFLKLAGLLHDVSKPETRTVESSGRIRFLGHHARGAEVAEDILKRLRIGGRGVETVRLMVHHHLRPGQMANQGELPTGKAIFRYFRDVGDAAIDTLYLNMADHLAARGPLMGEQEWAERCRTIQHILHEGLEQRAPNALPKLLDGHDIMDCFSLSPGPKVGRLMDLVEEARANGEVNSRDEALRLVRADLQAERDIA